MRALLEALRRELLRKERLGPLAAPLLSMGLLGSIELTLQDARLDLAPAPQLAFLAVAAVFLGTGRRRLAFVPLFAAAGAFVALGPRDGLDLFLDGLRACIFAALLVPVILASLRAGWSRPGTLTHRSQTRSPFVLAVGLAPVVAYTVSGFAHREGFDFGPGLAHTRYPPWQAYLPWYYALHGALVAVLTALDAAALLRTVRWRALLSAGGELPLGSPSTDLGVGEEVHAWRAPPGSYREAAATATLRGSPAAAIRELLVSLGIDALAGGMLTACAAWLPVLPVEPLR